MISLVVNTAAGENTKYARRSFALQNFILPQYLADPYIDEVLVVGSWKEGDGYQYIPSPSVHFSAVDALQQRQLGFEASKGDVVIFQHDDHVLQNHHWVGDLSDEDECELDQALEYTHWGNHVWSPSRYTRLRNINGERLNNGEPGYNEWVPPGGHLSGHACIFRREVIEKCPWTSAEHVFTWDVSMTQNIVAAGFKIVHTDAIRCWDVSFGEEPWK